jgi:hypothetical protein
MVNPNQTDPSELKKLLLGWLFFMTKFIEFADTIFFILRKKTRQISALHVIHHALVPILVYSSKKKIQTISSKFIYLKILKPGMDWVQVCARRLERLFPSNQFTRTHHYVYILWFVNIRAKNSALFMVEKVFDQNSNGSICANNN